MADVLDDEDLPRAFGAYLLLQNFARGGMGEVYLAKSGGIAGLERVCVLKKLRPDLTDNREYVTRFVDEARVVVTLNHANICNVFDVGRVQGEDGADEYYLAMEYIAGKDLRTLQDRCRKLQRPLDEATAIHVIAEVLRALDYAHRRKDPVTGEPLNLVHRDVSPQNVLVSFEGEIKLIDFGLAASRRKVERTQPNVVMGKMAYMAPEQARGDPIDARADLFACAVMLYELLVNERYYEGMTAQDIWQVAGKGGFQPRAWAGIDAGLQNILSQALHHEPRRRPPTCGDLRDALLQYAAGHHLAGAERSLRARIDEVFAAEQAREREQMVRFGAVTIASYRAAIDRDATRAVNLAGTTSASTSGALPPPSAPLHGDGQGGGSETELRPTRGAGSTTLEDPTLPGSQTEEGTPMPAPVLRPRVPTIHDERTQLRTANEPTRILRTAPVDEATLQAPSPRPAWLLPAIGATTAVVLVFAGVLWRSSQTSAPTVPPPTAIKADVRPGHPPTPTSEPSVEQEELRHRRRQWERLLRKNLAAPCVVALIERRRQRTEGAFLEEAWSDVLACIDDVAGQP